MPEAFIRGLTTASIQGRAQVIPDRECDIHSPGNLVFYLDGAHSPESMEVCANWFSHAVKEDDGHQRGSCNQKLDDSRASSELIHNSPRDSSRNDTAQVKFGNKVKYAFLTC